MAAGRHEVAFVVGAVVGSVAGAVYGLLNAPQAGWRTRSELSGYAEELGDRVAARVTATLADLRALTGAPDDDWETPLPELADLPPAGPPDLARPDRTSSHRSEGVIHS